MGKGVSSAFSVSAIGQLLSDIHFARPPLGGWGGVMRQRIPQLLGLRGIISRPRGRPRAETPAGASPAEMGEQAPSFESKGKSVEYFVMSVLPCCVYLDIFRYLVVLTFVNSSRSLASVMCLFLFFSSSFLQLFCHHTPAVFTFSACHSFVNTSCFLLLSFLLLFPPTLRFD